MRLIDADALTYKIIVSRNISEAPWEHYIWMQNIVNDAPTIDPVEHGYWGEWHDEYGDLDYICSVCGRYALYKRNSIKYKLSKFCPHCGAKMEVNDNEKL